MVTWGKYHIPADWAILIPFGLVLLAILLSWLLVILWDWIFGEAPPEKSND